MTNSKSAPFAPILCCKAPAALAKLATLWCAIRTPKIIPNHDSQKDAN